jgi:hypothetical protein
MNYLAIAGTDALPDCTFRLNDQRVDAFQCQTAGTGKTDDACTYDNCRDLELHLCLARVQAGND